MSQKKAQRGTRNTETKHATTSPSPHLHHFSPFHQTRARDGNPRKSFVGIQSMGKPGAIEVAKTVIEVADVAWKAIECHHHHHNPHGHEHEHEASISPSSEDELESLRRENRRLRNLLEQNLKLLQNVSELPCLLNDCPPDVRKSLPLSLRFLPIFWSSLFVRIFLSVP